METYDYSLEDQADILLSIVPQGDTPHLSQMQLVRKLRDDHRKPRCRGERAAPCEATAFLQRHALSSVIRLAGLTRKQHAVLRARVAGNTWQEIGSRFRHSKQAAQRIFSRALFKIRRAWKQYPLAGLPEVYRQEVRRYTPRRH